MFFFRWVSFVFGLFHYQNKFNRIILPNAFRGLDELCSEVPEDSWMLKYYAVYYMIAELI